MERHTPATGNNIEGRATMDGQALGEKSVGTASLAQGQSFSTQDGRAGFLLAPSIFLRIDHKTTVEMANLGLADTLRAVPKVRAMVGVAEIRPEKNVRINAQSATTRLLKPGLYDLDADRGQIRLFDGKAAVRVGERRLELKSGHELSLGALGLLKPQRFDKKPAMTFIRWSSQRSSYLAETNVDAARRYVTGWGWGRSWYGAGWYWDPWFDAYMFTPDGIFYGPFRWGFYSPWLVYEIRYFAYGYPFGYGPYHRHFSRGAFGALESASAVAVVGLAPVPVLVELQVSLEGASTAAGTAKIHPLFVAKGYRGIHSRGPVGRQVAGQKTD